LQDLGNYYSTSSPTIQHKLTGLIFPEKLVFTGTTYKTNKMNEVFSLICSISLGLQKNSPAKLARLYKEAPPSGLEPETL
jgi:hypothetical protein